MNTHSLCVINQLSDRQLVSHVKVLAAHERASTATLIAHIAVMDGRRLYLEEGCTSMYAYCVEVLHLSEDATYGRIAAARAAHRAQIPHHSRPAGRRIGESDHNKTGGASPHP